MKYPVIFLALLLLVASVSAQGWCGTQTVFFTHENQTDIPAYETLRNYPAGSIEDDENVTVKNTLGYVLIDTYITDPNTPDATSLLKGLRRYRVYSYVSSATGTTILNFTFFKRSTTGIETILYSVESADIDDLAVTEQLIGYVSTQDFPLASTDRVGVKVYGKTDHASNIYLHFVYEGSTHASHLESGYYQCAEADTSNAGANGIMYGLVGGLIGAVLVFRKMERRR